MKEDLRSRNVDINQLEKMLKSVGTTQSEVARGAPEWTPISCKGKGRDVVIQVGAASGSNELGSDEQVTVEF